MFRPLVKAKEIQEAADKAAKRYADIAVTMPAAEWSRIFVKLLKSHRGCNEWEALRAARDAEVDFDVELREARPEGLRGPQHRGPVPLVARPEVQALF